MAITEKHPLELLNALRISHPARVAMVGAGGKTTALFQLARQLKAPVVVTATAHMGIWQITQADRHLIAESAAELEALWSSRGDVTLVTGRIAGERTHPVSEDTINWLREACDNDNIPLLVEADGSRQMPLKAPAAHEPPMPSFANTVVTVAGLSGLGKSLDEEHVFRPEIFAALGGMEMGAPVTPDALVRVLLHPAGGLKNIPAGARRVALLNQADSHFLQAQASRMAGSLLEEYDAVLIASLGQEPANRIHAVHEPIAGIILAAGGASRYGAPKQLLDWRGQPFVRRVAQTALQAGLDPVIVVTGFKSAEAATVLKGLPVTMAYNKEWQAGQGVSIQVGMNALLNFSRDSERLKQGRAGSGGAVFLLADQPQVTVNVIRALVEWHAASLRPLVVPLVLERRANPVLFDRAAFPDLTQLTGDIGGRALFSKYPIAYLPWHDEALLLDVDMPEDYRRLLEFCS